MIKYKKIVYRLLPFQNERKSLLCGELVFKMSKEAIRVIKEAEEKAKIIVAEASENAKAMVADAEKKAERLRTEAEESTAAELKRTLYAMREKTDALIEKSLQDARAEADELIAKADIKKLSAVKKVIWEIIEA